MAAADADVAGSTGAAAMVTVVVQVNGKVRGRITVPATATEDQRREAALACPEAQSHLAGKEIIKVVLPPGGKLVSIVVKG